VIVLHPDVIFGFDQRQDRIGKPFIRAAIPPGKATFVFGQVDAVMEQRPEGAVGKAVVVFLDVLVFQIDCRGANPVLSPDQPNQMPPFS